VDHAQIDQILVAARHGELKMDGLFQARRGTHIVGVAWGQLVPGRTAFCWPPCLTPGESDETADRLQRAVDSFLDGADVTITQAVLATSTGSEAVRLMRAGYRHLMELDYLACSSVHFPRQHPHSDLQFEVCAEVAQDRLATVVQRTYVDSLDCSELDGMRSIADVFAGYRETGVHRPEWWIIGTYQGDDVSCVMLADHPRQNQCELMYLGIVPEMRGCGWGLETTRYAQWMAQRSVRERMVLAVDAVNLPARNIYLAAGFEPWERRSVFIRSASGSR
jgi:ribosomal protein S18 acetylase RimI-like enzyme